MTNAGNPPSGNELVPLRILHGTTKTPDEHNTVSEGKKVPATGCSNTAGKLTLTTPSNENVIAMTVYLCIKNSKEPVKEVDTSAVVTGRGYPAIVDPTKEGVAATDAGTNCSVEGKPTGDADIVVVTGTVSYTILAFGGAGLTITMTSP